MIIVRMNKFYKSSQKLLYELALPTLMLLTKLWKVKGMKVEVVAAMYMVKKRDVIMKTITETTTKHYQESLQGRERDNSTLK